MATRFSHRYGYHPLAGKVFYEEAPKAFRTHFARILDEFCTADALPPLRELYKHITRVLAREYSEADATNFWIYESIRRDFWQSLKWYEFFDLIEHFAAVTPRKEAYATAINELFEEHSIGWRLKEGQLVRTTSAATDKAIEEAFEALEAPEFQGPSAQLQKAIEFLSRRPRPDLENVVKEAVGALEAAARVITGDHSATLGDAIKSLVKQKRIQKPLDKVFEGVYGFRSSVPVLATECTKNQPWNPPRQSWF